MIERGLGRGNYVSGNIPKVSRARGIRLERGVVKRLCLVGCVSTLRERG